MKGLIDFIKTTVIGGVVPIGILMWIYYALRRHTDRQAAS